MTLTKGITIERANERAECIKKERTSEINNELQKERMHAYMK